MIKLYATIAALAISFGGGWATNGWRLTSQHQAEKLEQAKSYELEIKTLSASNDQHLQNLRDSQNETNRLHDCVRTGACGLRFNTPAAKQSTTGARVDHEAGAELAGSVGQAYFALREGIDSARAQLEACQDQLRIRQ